MTDELYDTDLCAFTAAYIQHYTHTHTHTHTPAPQIRWVSSDIAHSIYLLTYLLK